MFRIWVKKTIWIFSLMLLVFSCSGNRAEKNAEPATIRWWHINSDMPTHKTFTEIGEAFEEEHPNVTVEVTLLENIEYKPKLELQFSAQDPPEIFHSWGGGGLMEQAKAGYLKDITSWVHSDEWESQINPAALEIYSYDGKVYGFPHDMGAVGFWYNEELLQQAGYQEFPETWEGLIKLLDDLKAEGITPVSLGIADRWPVMYYWVYLTMRLGGYDIFQKILENEEDFNNPYMIQAGMMMQEFNQGGYIPETSLGDDFSTQSRYMGDGQCAMQLMGQWALAVQAQSSEKERELEPLMKFAPFPTVQGGKGSLNDAMGGGNGFVIGSNAPDEAVKLLEYFTRKDNLQKYFDNFPAIPTVAGVHIESESMNTLSEYVQNASHFSLYPDQLFPQEIGVLLNETSARVMLGGISAEEGCKILDEAWQAY